MTDWKETIPLVGAYQQTKDTWRGFDTAQRRATLLASTATFGRIGLRLLAEHGQNSGKLSRTQAVFTHAVLDLADMVDGRIARAGNAVTPWGKVADPLADKIDFAIQDIAQVRRGEMSGMEVGIRIARDVMSTGLRHYESLHPDETGAVSTAATWAGKSSTLSRSAANRINDIAPGSRVATITRHAATVGLMASLASNVRDFVHRHKGN